MMPAFDLSEACSQELDRVDPLARFQGRFCIPKGTIYMDGNSLGPLSRDAETALLATLDEWRRLGVRGWLEAERPWFHYAERLGAMAASLVGAAPDEVVMTGTTTVNIHALVSTFFQPAGKRRKILANALDFPTDIYALRDQLRLKGCDPQADLLLVPSADGRTVEEQAIVEQMTDEVALVFLPSVLYRSGQLLDIPRLTEEAHRREIPIGFDCCHSVGAVAHRFDAWDVDFAVWCSYKYLNAGPGAGAFLYINRRHFHRRPEITGWFGCRKDKQFEMTLDFEQQQSAGGWQISSPGILGSAPLEGALGILLEAGVDNIRAKSMALTSYLIYLVDGLLAQDPYGFRVGSPREAARRGGHVALERERDALGICLALRGRGVVPDFRSPNIIRIAPVALYSTFHQVWQVVHHLKEIIEGEEHRRYAGIWSMVP